MSAPPYMPLYIADYHADTTHLSRGEHGAYLLLLMAMWRAGGRLPYNDTKLGLLAKCTPDEWADIRPAIMEFFKRRGGHLTHKRVTSEIAKYENRIVRSKRGGKGLAEKKAKENSEKMLILAGPEPSQPEPEPEPEPIEKETPTVLARVRASRLPDDWEPGPEDVVYATIAGLTIEQTRQQGRRFRNYWTAKSGKDATKIRWDRTWQNWVDTEAAKIVGASRERKVDWC